MFLLLNAQKDLLFLTFPTSYLANTRALVESKDKVIFSLLTNAEYKTTKVLPDGAYKH